MKIVFEIVSVIQAWKTGYAHFKGVLIVFGGEFNFCEQIDVFFEFKLLNF